MLRAVTVGTLYTEHAVKIPEGTLVVYWPDDIEITEEGTKVLRLKTAYGWVTCAISRIRSVM